jgi:hypothetical protein
MPSGILCGSSVAGSYATTIGGDSPERGVPEVALQTRGEYIPPHLRLGMVATRLANAYWNSYRSDVPMRFVLLANIHEAQLPEEEIRVLDTLTDWSMTVPDLLSWLPEDLRERVHHQAKAW